MSSFIVLFQGCDASIMIASRNGDAEKDAPDNLSLAGDGFDTVIKAKRAVEAKCPKVVSCADILAVATRDVIVLVRNAPTILPEIHDPCEANLIYLSSCLSMSRLEVLHSK